MLPEWVAWAEWVVWVAWADSNPPIVFFCNFVVASVRKIPHVCLIHSGFCGRQALLELAKKILIVLPKRSLEIAAFFIV